MKDKTKFTTKMRDDCLNPEKKLDEKGLFALITLFRKYPQAPKGQELARMEEQRRMREVQETIQEMFPFEEDE